MRRYRLGLLAALSVAALAVGLGSAPAGARRPAWAGPKKTTTTVAATTTSTTVAPTTTSASPTTTTAVDPTTTTLPTAEPPYTPPVMDLNPLDVNASGCTNTTTEGGTGTARRDVTVHITGKVTCRLTVWNGRNVKIIGGEVDIDTCFASPDDRNILRISGATGHVFIDHFLGWGDCANDVQIALEGSDTTDARTITIQRSHLEVRDPAGAYHADVVQPYRGFRAFRMFEVTGWTQFQGGMFKADWNRWLDTHWRRVNFHTIQPRAGKPINMVVGCCNNDGFPFVTGPIALTEVYAAGDGSLFSEILNPLADWAITTDPDGRQQAAWLGDPNGPAAGVVTGVVHDGIPAAGDFSPPNVNNGMAWAA